MLENQIPAGSSDEVMAGSGDLDIGQRGSLSVGRKHRHSPESTEAQMNKAFRVITKV
jgi:hypothetical protein